MRSVSVAIRSVRVNPFLDQLLSSLELQTIQLSEIVIVIPDDAKDCDDWSGVVENCKVPVRIVTAKRGMITQRAAGISACTGMVLLLDDDLILPPAFAEKMLSTWECTGAKCVVPFTADAYPRSRMTKLFSSIFRIAVPYKGKGGNKLLLSGGFAYPTSSLSYGDFAETDLGIGAAILVDSDWVREHNSLGDLSLQLQDNPYALREDGAFVCLQRLEGGRAFIVNAGDIVHLGGTTRIDSRRRMWVMDASVYNNFVFWRRYIYTRQPTLTRRVGAIFASLPHLLGLNVLAVLSAIRNRSASPIHGLMRGYARLCRMQW